MKRFFWIFLVWCFGAVVSAHDLDLTLVEIKGQHIRVTTALSRLVRTTNADLPSLNEAFKSRIGESNLKGEPKIEIIGDQDTVVWESEITPGFELSRPFYPDDLSAKTVILNSDGTRTVLRVDPQLLKAGFLHILSGLDHILFVLGLVLIGGDWKQILKVLSAFTIAHSITLGLCASGLLPTFPRITEPLIALSIVVLAVEAISGKGEKLRLGIALVFGLVHGCGFAGGMSHLGLRGGELIQNLLVFTLGIESGQILVASAGLGLAFLCAKQPKILVASKIALGMIGSFWFIERIVR